MESTALDEAGTLTREATTRVCLMSRELDEVKFRDEVISNYRAALSLLYGDKWEEQVIVEYRSDGYYYIEHPGGENPNKYAEDVVIAVTDQLLDMVDDKDLVDQRSDVGFAIPYDHVTNGVDLRPR